MTEVFSFIGSFIDTIRNGIESILNFIIGIFTLLGTIITLLPAEIGIITGTGIVILNIIVVYKLIRKG